MGKRLILIVLTYAELHRRPELVASAAGKVTSTPSSIATGIKPRAKNPTTQSVMATTAGISSIIAT